MTIPASGGSATIEREQTEQLAEPGDHERFSHYAPKDKIMESMVTGTPLIALCGKVAGSQFADPERFPICPEVQEIYETMSEGPQE